MHKWHQFQFLDLLLHGTRRNSNIFLIKKHKFFIFIFFKFDLFLLIKKLLLLTRHKLLKTIIKFTIKYLMYMKKIIAMISHFLYYLYNSIENSVMLKNHIYL